MKNYLLWFTVCAALLSSLGCGEQAPARAKVAPLPHMHTSIEALVAAVVQAVADSNEDMLYNFVVTKDEYRDVVWANLSEAERNMVPMDEAWKWNARDIDKTISRYLSDYGGTELQLTRIHPPQEVRPRNKINVHRGTWIEVTPAGGQAETWRMLNVVMEYEGWFKVIAYND